MKKIFKLTLSFFIFIIIGCETNSNDTSKINQVMDQWHESASEANYENYFDAMDEKSVFIGTDAAENWTKEEFQSFSKPYFDEGKAWSFEAIERNIYFSESGEIAWFDELLDTWMGTCRGSGVLEKKDHSWKLKHYVLSVSVPNEDIQKVISVKSKNDSLFRVSFNAQ